MGRNRPPLPTRQELGDKPPRSYGVQCYTDEGETAWRAHGNGRWLAGSYGKHANRVGAEGNVLATLKALVTATKPIKKKKKKRK